MAVLYISEYAALPFVDAHSIAIVQEPPHVEQTVAVGTVTQSNAFDNRTKIIRVHTDAICSILTGANPTATTANKRLAANQTEYFYVSPGHKMSVISNT